MLMTIILMMMMIMIMMTMIMRMETIRDVINKRRIK